MSKSSKSSWSKGEESILAERTTEHKVFFLPGDLRDFPVSFGGSEAAIFVQVSPQDYQLVRFTREATGLEGLDEVQQAVQ